MARALARDDDKITVREADLELSIPTDPEVRYTLRSIGLEEARAVIKKHTKTVPRRGRNDEVVNTGAVHEELLGACLLGWEGIVDQGQPVPCTVEHALRLPGAIQFALVERAQAGQVIPSDLRAASFRQPA